MKQMLIMAMVLAGCGGVDPELEETETSAVEAEADAVGCKGKAYAYCLECIGIHCSLEQCTPTEHHFWRGQQNDNRARCKQLVSNWAKPKVCDGLPILVYSYWFRTTSGQEGESGFLSCD